MDYRSIARKAGYVTGGLAGALALFLPSTPKHKSIDSEVMKNLKPGNSQTQQVAHSQPTLDEYIGATTGYTAEKAYAGGMKEIEEAKDRCERQTGNDNCIFVDDYYNCAEPVNDPDMPEGLKYHKWYSQDFMIKTQEDKDPNYLKNGKFTDLFFSEKLHDPLLNVFANEGYSKDKINNFFKNHRDEKIANFYRDGYMILTDANDERTYILPLSKHAISTIFD